MHPQQDWITRTRVVQLTRDLKAEFTLTANMRDICCLLVTCDALCDLSRWFTTNLHVEWATCEHMEINVVLNKTICGKANLNLNRRIRKYLNGGFSVRHQYIHCSDYIFQYNRSNLKKRHKNTVQPLGEHLI